MLFPGAVDFIRAAAAAVPIAIASGALRHEIDEIIDAAGIGDLFATIVASGDTPRASRRRRRTAWRSSGCATPAGATSTRAARVAIEDSRWGLESARGAGLRCVGVTNSYPADELDGAELIVDGLGALTLAALDELCANHMRKDLVDALVAASNAPGTGLAQAALVIARIEYPRLDAEPYLARLDGMGDAARRRISRHVEDTGDSSPLVVHQRRSTPTSSTSCGSSATAISTRIRATAA